MEARFTYADKLPATVRFRIRMKFRLREMPTSTSRTTRFGPRPIAALLALQLGLLAVVLASTPFKQFDLDRFFVPKELALHVAAFLAVVFCLNRLRNVSLDRVDYFLIAFALLSLVSALLASNRWLSMRSVAVTLSGLATFWCARSLARAGLKRPLAAIGAPLLIWYAVSAKRNIAVVLCAIGGAVLAAALVLSRSRAAWLALLVTALLLAIPAWRAARRVPYANTSRRLLFMGAGAVAGVIIALVLPNDLNWRSDSPYLDSVRGVVAYNSGSGRGRLIQYRNTLHMAEAHPILGVGPGNWPVYYPKFATHNDPSLSHNDGTTANPWPSSDWATLISERGTIAVVILLLAFLGMIANAFQSTRGSSANNPGARDPFLPVAVTATILITGAVGAFDAVLILAAPTFIVWAALGATAAPGRPRTEWSPSVSYT